MSKQIQLSENMPTSQEIEQALINVIKAGIYYRRPKDGKFMQSYKERVKKLRQAEDPEEYVLKTAQSMFPNVDKYHKTINDYKGYYEKDPKIYNAIIELCKLYYRLAKNHFITESQIDEEAEDFLNS